MNRAGLTQDLRSIGGTVGLVFRPRGTGRPGDALRGGPYGFRSQAPGFILYCQPDRQPFVQVSASGMHPRNQVREWQLLEDLTPEAVRTGAVRVIEEVFTLPAARPRSGYLRGNVMKPTSGETTGPVTLKRVRAAEFMGGDLPPGIPLNVEVEYGGGDGRFFGYRLAEHLREALGIRDFHHDVHSGDPHVIHVRVRRDEMEEVVLAIPAAIAEFNESFPQLLAEHEREVEHKKAEQATEQAAERERREHQFDAEQQVIDRLMNRTGEPEAPPSPG